MTDSKLALVERTQIERAQSLVLSFTPEQSQMIRDTYANGASESEFAFLMEIAKARKLNPLLRQIHFVSRPDRQKGRNVWSAQVSIDGLRSVADRTGLYDGQDEPEHEYDKDGGLVTSRVKVYRKGIARPFVGVARWSEYVQSTREGTPTHFWREMAHTMLDKCAEALAMRKAFPEDTAGLYVAEEMQQEREQLPAPHSPHGERSDYPNPETSDFFDSICGRIATVRNGLDSCASYSQVLALRSALGSKATPQGTALTRDMQRAREENLVGFDGLKEISRRWNHCDRQLQKLEAQFPAPSAEEIAHESDEAEEFDR